MHQRRVLQAALSILQAADKQRIVGSTLNLDLAAGQASTAGAFLLLVNMHTSCAYQLDSGSGVCGGRHPLSQCRCVFFPLVKAAGTAWTVWSPDVRAAAEAAWGVHAVEKYGWGDGKSMRCTPLGST